MRCRIGLAAAVFFATLSACSWLGPNAIAVINDTDQAFYLRFEGTAVWEIPAHSRGVGPTNVTSGGRQTEILRLDCTTFAAWGLPGPTTITITTDEDSEPRLIDGVTVSEHLTPSDRCHLT